MILFENNRYRMKREKFVECASAAVVSTMWGHFKAYCYRSCLDGIEHIAMVKVSNSSIFVCLINSMLNCNRQIAIHFKSIRFLGYVYMLFSLETLALARVKL